MFKAYRNRVQVDGENSQDSMINATKRQMVNYILDSPSLSYVLVNMQETLPLPSIVTDIRTFYERKFLFLPDINVNIGDYVSHQGFTYLATNKVFNNIFPQLTGELCNTEFLIQLGETKVKVGNDAMGRPIYKTEKVTITKPCVFSDKIYSQANNSPIPLPDGAVIVKLPYSKDNNQIPKINSTVEIYSNKYQITSVSNEYVVNNIGYIEVQLQRIPTT